MKDRHNFENEKFKKLITNIDPMDVTIGIILTAIIMSTAVMVGGVINTSIKQNKSKKIEKRIAKNKKIQKKTTKTNQTNQSKQEREISYIYKDNNITLNLTLYKYYEPEVSLSVETNKDSLNIYYSDVKHDYFEKSNAYNISFIIPNYNVSHIKAAYVLSCYYDDGFKVGFEDDKQVRINLYGKTTVICPNRSFQIFNKKNDKTIIVRRNGIYSIDFFDDHFQRLFSFFSSCVNLPTIYRGIERYSEYYQSLKILIPYLNLVSEDNSSPVVFIKIGNIYPWTTNINNDPFIFYKKKFEEVLGLRNIGKLKGSKDKYLIGKTYYAFFKDKIENEVNLISSFFPANIYFSKFSIIKLKDGKYYYGYYIPLNEVDNIDGFYPIPHEFKKIYFWIKPITKYSLNLTNPLQKIVHKKFLSKKEKNIIVLVYKDKNNHLQAEALVYDNISCNLTIYKDEKKELALTNLKNCEFILDPNKIFKNTQGTLSYSSYCNSYDTFYIYKITDKITNKTYLALVNETLDDLIDILYPEIWDIKGIDTYDLLNITCEDSYLDIDSDLNLSDIKLKLKSDMESKIKYKIKYKIINPRKIKLKFAKYLPIRELQYKLANYLKIKKHKIFFSIPKNEAKNFTCYYSESGSYDDFIKINCTNFTTDCGYDCVINPKECYYYCHYNILVSYNNWFIPIYFVISNTTKPAILFEDSEFSFLVPYYKYNKKTYKKYIKLYQDMHKEIKSF